MLRKSLLFFTVFFIFCSAAPVKASAVNSYNGLAMATNEFSVNCCPDECEQQEISLKTPCMSGPEIAEYQTALRKLSFYKGEIDGIYTPATMQAVKEFQHRNNLKADGVIGIKTGRILADRFESGVVLTSKKTAPKGEVDIVIDVNRRKLTIYDDQKKFKEYNVAVGEDRTPTPIGDWKITRKAMHWGTGFGTRWMGLNVPWGIYGIHGTNKPWSIGTEASHGCIRMMNHDVEEIYPWVKAGTVVRIIGEVYPQRYEERDPVHRGHRGTAVLLVQQGLIAEGYLSAKADGIFGYVTESALKQLQKDRGFEVTGQVDIDIWPVLGL